MSVNMEGMVMTCSGPWPRERMAPTTLLSNDLAIELVNDAKALHELMVEQKRRMFEKARNYETALLEQYRVKKRKGSRGAFQAESLDSCFKVELSVADFRRVTSDIMAAQALMGEVLDDLTENVSPDIRLLLSAAFEPDERTGRVNVDRLQQVRKVRLTHPRWPDVMEAVANSIEVSSSKPYLRFYWRETRDQDWQAIRLQFSSLEVV
ncbi:DUF3164 family protein [Acetobacter fabarum]|uniref:DUF3164 family protein n=1 Tax=Acetobacter fabarum TaxID=483199 RepID=UPI00312B7E95